MIVKSLLASVSVSRRRYGQFCPLARSLDLLGERWTLLIVRDLLAGPRRYTDLRTSLLGLATDVLATRLRELQDAGIVRRREIPPPTPAAVYELTERGQGLKPTIVELSRWGRDLLADATPGDRLPESMRALGFEVAFHPEEAHGIEETYEVEVDGNRVGLHVRDGTLRVEPGGAPDAVVKVATDEQGFMEMARSRPSERVQVEGDPAAYARMGRMFYLTR